MKSKIVSIKKKPIKVIDALSHLLADTYIVYLKTQNFHWNVVGPNFASLHKMFEEQYTALAAAIDEIAERIRALHAKAPATLADYLKLSSITEAHGHPDATKMVQELMHSHEKMASNIQDFFATAKEHDDEVTFDLLIERKNFHEKTAWMLRSTLGRV